MILIAPDKYKGTLSAIEAAKRMAQALSSFPTLLAPMADGGEGTASVLCSDMPWEKRSLDIDDHICQYYINPENKSAAVDSSAVVGINRSVSILYQTSYKLGLLAKRLAERGCDKIVIGIGGTGFCDGGVGFLQGLGLEDLHLYRDILVGLCDVRVPLLPESGQCNELEPSALMFARQKGATDQDLPILYSRLKEAYHRYARVGSTPYDGAGGGLGFALANAIGAQCLDGAPYVLNQYDINWEGIDAVITGEGRIDRQTRQGKVVDVIYNACREHGIPCFAVGGTVDDNCGYDNVIAADQFLPDSPLTPEVADMRIQMAVQSIAKNLGTH